MNYDERFAIVSNILLSVSVNVAADTQRACSRKLFSEPHLPTVEVEKPELPLIDSSFGFEGK